jgi:hypothetical protein
MLDGEPQAKEGRANYKNDKLKKVPYPIYWYDLRSERIYIKEWLKGDS